MNKRFIVVSPTFSGFRAYEPLAFKYAEEFMNNTKDSTNSEYSAKYVREEGIVKVWIKNDEFPFEFIVADTLASTYE